MRFLIPTYPADVHAIEVAQVLEERGHEAVLWHGSDFPTLQSASVDIRGGQVAWELEGLGLEGRVRPPFDVVWYRRPTTPVLPESLLHPGDLPVARRECYDFFAGLYHLAAPDAFWVNPLAARRAELKPVQLRDAVRAGLTVPATLLSNDPGRIRRFLDEHQGRAIYKPFHPAQWDKDDQVAVLLTSEVGPGDLPEDEILRLTPGIFQEKVEKDHELRVTVMGEHVVTAKLLSQRSEETRTDWRAGAGRLDVEPGELPREVEEGCLRVMRSLGILFGAFDFIVTPEGEHVFLEVNPAGQFLWVEETCPDLLLLAPFVDFLLARRPDFRWTPSAGAIRHADRKPAAAERIRELVARHAAPENVFISSDLEEETADRVSDRG